MHRGGRVHGNITYRTYRLAGAFVLTRALSAALWQVSATDPLTYALVAAVVLLVAAFASWVPARRVTRVDPMGPLRAE